MKDEIIKLSEGIKREETENLCKKREEQSAWKRKAWTKCTYQKQWSRIWSQSPEPTLNGPAPQHYRSRQNKKTREQEEEGGDIKYRKR